MARDAALIPLDGGLVPPLSVFTTSTWAARPARQRRDLATLVSRGA